MIIAGAAVSFQSPIGWGLSCEAAARIQANTRLASVSIPYWLGSKLRGWGGSADTGRNPGGFNPLLVGV